MKQPLYIRRAACATLDGPLGAMLDGEGPPSSMPREVTLPRDLPIPADLTSPDPLGQMALRLAAALLHDITNRDRVGLILGTTLGCLEIDRDFDRSRRDAGGRFASPAAFSRTLPSAIAAELSVKLAVRGPVLIVSAGSASAAVALRRAASWLRHLHLEACLAGGLDWTGPGLPAPQTCRAAFVLLSADSAGAIASLNLGAHAAPDTSALLDDSLTQLTAWIQSPTRVSLPADITLSPVP